MDRRLIQYRLEFIVLVAGCLQTNEGIGDIFRGVIERRKGGRRNREESDQEKEKSEFHWRVTKKELESFARKCLKIILSFYFKFVHDALKNGLLGLENISLKIQFAMIIEQNYSLFVELKEYDEKYLS